MNEVAQDTGAVKTRFSNPHGLDATAGFVHESTAADIGRIAAAAMRCRLFQRISAAPRHSAPVWRAAGVGTAAGSAVVPGGDDVGKGSADSPHAAQNPAAAARDDAAAGAGQRATVAPAGGNAGAGDASSDNDSERVSAAECGSSKLLTSDSGTVGRHGRAAEKLIGKVQKQRAVQVATEDLAAQGFVKSHVRTWLVATSLRALHHKWQLL